MNTHPRPICCTPLSDEWPFAHPLPSLQLISTRFDSALLDPADFARCNIAPIKGVSKRQAEYLAGRACAQEALHRLTGTATAPASGEDRAPVWPTGSLGSITHSNGFAAAITGSSQQWQGLGLDAESLIPDERAHRLAEEILTPAEMSRLHTLPPAEQALRITLTFSVKESLFKALYPLVLKRFYFHDAELIEVDPQQRVSLRLLLDLSENWPAGRIVAGQFCLFEGYLLSLISITR